MTQIDPPSTGTNPGTSGESETAAPLSVSAPETLTRAGAAWVATGVSLVLLVLLIVFILQNSTSVSLKFLGFEGDVSVGVGMLVAAVVGGALVAVAGVARVLQLRKAVHRLKKR